MHWQQTDRSFPLSELLGSVTWSDTDVSGLHIGTIFKSQGPTFNGHAWPLKMGRIYSTETSASILHCTTTQKMEDFISTAEEARDHTTNEFLSHLLFLLVSLKHQNALYICYSSNNDVTFEAKYWALVETNLNNVWKLNSDLAWNKIILQKQVQLVSDVKRNNSSWYDSYKKHR